MIERKPAIRTSTRSIVNEVGDKRPGHPVIESALKESREMVFSTLREANLEELDLVLHARRRVTQTLDGSRNNTFFQNTSL